MPIPQSLHRLFWSDDAKRLDTERHKAYIIHHVLLYGSFGDIRLLFSLYPREEVMNAFLKKPSKIYPKEVFHFVKNYVLPLRENTLDEQDYVTSLFGPIRQRTASSIS